MEPLRRAAAVFTIVCREPIFLPIWLKYYSLHFDAEDIYILHHIVPSAPEDLCTADVHCTVIRVAHEFFDPVWLRNVVCKHQSLLLDKYAAVLFAEVDEIIVPDSRDYPGGLREFIERFAHTQLMTARCTGWELHHNFAVEV